MAAYASLVSLMHITDQMQNHPRPPISLDQKQVESLTKNVTFLQEFLEGYSHVAGYSKESDALENRIADAAYAAEDIIESHIVDQILAGSTSHGEKIGSNIGFYVGVQKVIEDMDSIKKEVMEIKKRTSVQHQLQRNSSISAGSLRSASMGQNSAMVGFDDILYELMDKLTGGQPDRQIIPIVGMGGIGKTTLARNFYTKPLIVEYFDICAWVIISQEYDTRKILNEVLRQVNRGEGDSSEMSENELGEKLYKYLSGRRYLIVMDDIWSIQAWDKVKIFIPNYNNGSRIVITTRLSNLAFQLTDSNVLEMGFLDEEKSWNLFCKTVFGKEDCPLELEVIGKKIVENCRGLPLSIVVIGGILSKLSINTQEYWEYIEENLNSIVNLQDNERCLKILHMSYQQLPFYLKPCFLYMGVFKEDSVIHVSTLTKLWVAEGFLKPLSGKSLEEIAKEYLKELINRNLILVYKLVSTGEIKYCNVHDLVRDLCLREARKERFYNVVGQHSLNLPQGINTQRRIVNPQSFLEKNALAALQSMSLARSFICNISKLPKLFNFRLLRTLKTIVKAYYSDNYFLENMFQLVNLRYLDVRVHPGSKFPSSVCLLWNLHTLIVGNDHTERITAPAEIWNMPQLRHVKFTGGLYLPDPPSGNVNSRDDIILANLQTLERIRNFKCGEKVVKRIPNIKKLHIFYEEVEGSSRYHLNNLHLLHKLKNFHCFSYPEAGPSGTDFLLNLNFPNSLKKLDIAATHVHWEDMLEKIGSLPLLEKLQLIYGSFKERKWETTEGQFRSLKFLKIYYCFDLEYWTTNSSHFPCLAHIVLGHLYQLKEIPSDIGEIPTLQSIELRDCSDSAAFSAKKLLEEQEEVGEVGLQIRVRTRRWSEALKSSASPNFKVEYGYELPKEFGRIV